MPALRKRGPTGDARNAMLEEEARKRPSLADHQCIREEKRSVGARADNRRQGLGKLLWGAGLVIGHFHLEFRSSAFLGRELMPLPGVFRAANQRNTAKVRMEVTQQLQSLGDKVERHQ